MRHIVRGRSYKAEPTKTVTQAQRNQFGDLRVLLQFFHLGQRDVAGGGVDVKHTRQNQLHRAAFRTDDHVDSCQITLKSAVNLHTGE